MTTARFEKGDKVKVVGTYWTHSDKMTELVNNGATYTVSKSTEPGESVLLEEAGGYVFHPMTLQKVNEKRYITITHIKADGREAHNYMAEVLNANDKHMLLHHLDDGQVYLMRIKGLEYSEASDFDVDAYLTSPQVKGGGVEEGCAPFISDWAPPLWVRYAMDGQKIPAIKALRSRVSLGLREAKYVVDTITEEK